MQGQFSSLHTPAGEKGRKLWRKEERRGRQAECSEVLSGEDEEWRDLLTRTSPRKEETQRTPKLKTPK